MDIRDKAWIDALRRYLGDGTEHVPVPFYTNPDGTVDTIKTVDRFMTFWNINPAKEN